MIKLHPCYFDQPEIKTLQHKLLSQSQATFRTFLACHSEGAGTHQTSCQARAVAPLLVDRGRIDRQASRTFGNLSSPLSMVTDCMFGAKSLMADFFFASPLAEFSNRLLLAKND
jgi:hypothetical protein